VRERDGGGRRGARGRATEPARDTSPRGTAATAPIRILVADDHPVVREGLVAMLETQPDFAVVGEADSGAAVERQVAATGAFLTDLAPGGPTFHTAFVAEAIADAWELARAVGDDRSVTDDFVDARAARAHQVSAGLMDSHAVASTREANSASSSPCS
jgi:CheY-like chemotaxis protein